MFNQIRNDILGGEDMTTLKKVAEDAKVSITTVSRILNNDSSLSVAEKTRKRVLESARKLGYRKKTFEFPLFNIAFLYWLTKETEIEDVYFREMREEIENEAKKYNIEITCYTIEEGIDVVPKNIQGFIAVGSFKEKELNTLKEVTQNGVFIDTSPEATKYDSVRPDLYEITDHAIEYFIKSGHNEIGFIGGTFVDRDSETDFPDIRETQFRKKMKDMNLLDERYIYTSRGFTFKNGVSLMEKAIFELKDQMPTAFFVASDAIALGCLQVLNKRGYSVPKRVSIISINDISLAKYVTPPLTTFKINMSALVSNALKLLSEQILEERQYRKKLFIESDLIIRKTTR